MMKSLRHLRCKYYCIALFAIRSIYLENILHHRLLNSTLSLSLTFSANLEAEIEPNKSDDAHDVKDGIKANE